MFDQFLTRRSVGLTMNTSRIRMRDVYGQTPPNVFNDFDWIHRHQKVLLENYGERSIIVYKQEVIGVGSTYEEELQDAEQNLSTFKLILLDRMGRASLGPYKISRVFYLLVLSTST